MYIAQRKKDAEIPIPKFLQITSMEAHVIDSESK